MADWTETYRPSTLSEVRGNDKARDALREWAENWEDHRKAVILHGSPGVGKTSAAHALANDFDWPTIELNASDQRKADIVKRIAGEAAQSGTLTEGGAGRRLVILDEADNFHGNVDYGGSRAVTDVIKSASQPVVLIANEFYDMSQSLRNNCETVEFRDVSKRSIVPVLRDICRQEGIEFEAEALEAIAENTDGDLRSAINDLQAIAETEDRLTEEAVVTGERDRTKGIFDLLDEVIKTASAQEALYASYDVDETPDDLINWIEDNVPKDFSGAELADAYASLARADQWLGRVRATQNYSYWRYAGDNMTAGVAAARREPKGGWTRYGPPSYWRKLGSSRGARDRRDYVARKIAESGGMSMSSARREVLPYLAAMTHHCKNRELTVAMTARYELDADHVSFVTGSGKDTNKIQGIVADAQRLREEAAVEGSEGAFEGARRSNGGSEEGRNEPLGPDQPGENDDSEVDTDESNGDEGTDADESQSGLGDFM
ncbi:replication factor C large subunit [Halalkalicoccus paucihalophilus]|uniref:Replication factor C large subunit n=1 Tax=Halalkalicoccus paucihalophilus TaxID=1008153 RepID=A0A151AG18_9EURY|nr:replication factor C large subunit [Halalkalicoccus paucihalophilus]KYH26534.1 replication factor C large subunit [Halalkalicoccus paucihalophilus]